MSGNAPSQAWPTALRLASKLPGTASVAATTSFWTTLPPALTCSTPDTWVSSRTPSSSWPQAVPSARTALPQVLGIAGSFSCLRSQLQGSSEVTRSGRGHRVCQVRNLRPGSPPPSEESDLERGGEVHPLEKLFPSPPESFRAAPPIRLRPAFLPCPDQPQAQAPSIPL